MPEYRYTEPSANCSSEYLWPALLEILGKTAPPPSRVLDLGCGNGATARLLASRGYSVTGLDPSESGIGIARRHESDRLDFQIGSATGDVGARLGLFPVVVSLEVIEHCMSAFEFIHAFRSVLAPGGVGVISTPYHGYLKNLAIVASGKFDFHFNPLWEAGHIKFFTIAKLRELLERAGFREFEFHRVGRVAVLAKSVVAVVRG